jgi:hypothetical protein
MSVQAFTRHATYYGIDGGTALDKKVTPCQNAGSYPGAGLLIKGLARLAAWQLFLLTSVINNERAFFCDDELARRILAPPSITYTSLDLDREWTSTRSVTTWRKEDD